MAKQRKSARRSGIPAALAFAGAALLVAIPSAGFALGALDAESISLPASARLASFTPASVDPRLAELISHKSLPGSKLMRFTPAGASDRTNRAVTVAVRVDENTARAISVRQALAAAGDSSASVAAPRIAPTRYNLGRSLGYQSFARPPLLSDTLSDAAIPDLAAYQPSAGVAEKPSRFAARIALDQEEKTGRGARTRDSLGDQTVDVGGSYSLTRNLNVTAGVRYSQDRDRLEPLTNGKQDSQAVYVGTQFRF
ncbi:hypothetical protein SZ64_14570 [Erythrobacter sp. SG61-1L]|uniref:hypothetical protein n=1 Tax=Erythrobacter sp. SG61-1L TaxID=1603897 RepID=UPI0006C91532|nr:hypothetical protein [Erythrobacter sp. SG61-1L]KPL69218.1 hypothetical protein SZ64_14570 [Erythrobacter sp. SG61-1L]